MVNWRDPEIIERCKTGFVEVTLFLLGLYGCVCVPEGRPEDAYMVLGRWYYSNSLHVELALLRAKLPIRWAMVSMIAFHNVFARHDIFFRFPT